MKVRIPQGPSRNELMQKMQQLQEDAAQKQEELDNREYTATAGGGAVNVTINGLHEIKNLKIDPEIIEDAEMLEDLITVAVNEAVNNARKTSEEEMSAITGSLQIPGMPGMF